MKKQQLQNSHHEDAASFTVSQILFNIFNDKYQSNICRHEGGKRYDGRTIGKDL